MRQSLLKFEVENLGPLAAGTIDLADLTVLCGENNTGKTYLTHALYALLKIVGVSVELPQFDIPTLRRTGQLEIDLQQLVISRAEELVAKAVNLHSSYLYGVPTMPKERLNKTRMRLHLDFDGILTRGHHEEFTFGLDRHLVSFDKPENSPILTITTFTKEPEEAADRVPYKNLIEHIVRNICIMPAIPFPFIVSTERTGIVVFQGELNLAQSQIMSLMGKGDAEGIRDIPTSPSEAAHMSHYTRPIRDNVDFMNSIGIRDQESELLQAYPDILDDFEDLVGGSYQRQNSATYFVPKGHRSVRLSMSESSGVVRSLAILGFYLKHLAAPGALLMIDEPELNLHPGNQRKLARLLARLVKVGLRVFVTTHSDYIVKEFNTLIMWHTRQKQGQELPNDPRYTGENSLDPEKVRVYLLRPHRGRKNGTGRGATAPTLCEADINATFGIEVPSFDETIDDMNALQESLYYGTSYTNKAGT